MFQTIVMQIKWKNFLFNIETRAGVACIATLRVSIIIIASTLKLQYQGKGRIFGYLFVCFESHELFFSYLTTVTIAGDGAANRPMFSAYGF
jgi:hypothetical protein